MLPTIPPPLMAEIVRDAIESRMDLDIYRAVLAAEAVMHRDVLSTLEN